jgi:hypothetical protein
MIESRVQSWLPIRFPMIADGRNGCAPGSTSDRPVNGRSTHCWQGSSRHTYLALLDGNPDQ